MLSQMQDEGMKLRRYQGNPILKPKRGNDWESAAVFNAAVIRDSDIFHMLYRARGKDGISRLGYAVSKDGFNFLRLDKPVFEPEGEFETLGCEDPRIIRMGEEFYMTYTAYSKHGIRVSLAATKNFITWRRYGVIFPDVEDKDAVLFPEKRGGKYVMLHRPMPEKEPWGIWIAYSDDFLNWQGHKAVMMPREGHWDSVRIGAACPPFKTEEGWLLIYHGADDQEIYRLGVALLDLANPSLLLRRREDPILEPKEEYELHGQHPDVVFSCGGCEVDGSYYIYYGGADFVTCVATVEEDVVINSL